ncbi:MAG: methyltransferase domain-containing protein [Candidatus Aenigmarchaeota archaeon]|nr:methyltransferase domain-containing protein [Candidatus Aenigmarchaeota archaeon]
MVLSIDQWNDKIEKVKIHHLYGIAEYKRDEHLRLVNKWFGDLNEMTLLKTDSYEEAIGKDHFLDILGKRAKITIGMDISKKIILKTKRRHGDAFFRVICSVKRLPFKRGSIDMIMSNSTLDHVSVNGVIKSTEEFYYVLKNPGNLILTLDSKENLLYFLLCYIGKKMNIFPFSERCYTRKEMHKILTKYGFRINDDDAIVFIPPPLERFILLFKMLNNKVVNKLIYQIIFYFSKMKNKPFKYFLGRFVCTNAIKD